MPSYNKTILMGHMTRDPETRNLQSGSAVCNFGLAVNKKWKDRDGNQKEEVCFVDCAAFGRTAEVIAQYFKKGDAIFVEGSLRLETWESQDGGKRSKHSVTVDRFEFVGGKKGGQQGGDEDAPF